MSQKIKTSVEIDGSLTASQIANATTDTDKFLVSDGGTVKYRTGAELASDLGIASGSTSKVQHQVKAGVAINKGQAVYVTSADGTNMIVGLASNASEATSSKTMGLLNATVVANGFADVVTEGLLDGLDTSTATVGNPVWLGTGGNLIYGLANKPYAPNHLVFIGIVTRVNANNGEIFVKVQNGFELDEIHDVDLKTTAKINGHLLGYNGSLWVNKTIAEWLGYTPYNASNPAGYISSYTETDTLASVTARGATTGTSITVGGVFTTKGTNPYIQWQNSAGTRLGYIQHATNLVMSSDTGNIEFTPNSNLAKVIGNFEITGTLSASGYNKTNWDTAYGWGNHASAGYITQSTGDSRYIMGTTSPANVNNFTISIGNNGSYSYVQSHSSQPLELNPLGNDVRITGNTALHAGNYSSYAVPTSRTITINGTSYDLSANRSWTVTASETDTLATVTARGNSTSSPISVNSVTTTASTQANATLGTIASSWGGISYPTLYGSATDRWVMHINPHISYTQNGVNGFTGSMVGSTVRMASDTIATHYWDIGVGTNNVGIDRFSIGRNATNFLSINNSGNVISSIDMRSPIFYDSNDTTYYGDFNSTTRQYQAISFGDSSRYSAINTTINGSGAGDKLILYGGASNYDARLLVGADYDVLFKSQGNSAGKGSFKFYSGQNCNLAMTIDGSQYTSLTGGLSVAGNSSWFGGYGASSGLAFENQSSFARVVFWNLDFYEWDSGQIMTMNNGYVQANNSFRAPIFYDSNNTGYYVDPNSGSNLNNVTANEFYTNGWFRNNTTNTGLYNQVNGNHIYSRQGKRWGITGNDGAGSVWLDFYGNHESTYRGSVHADTSNNIGFLANDGGWGIRTVANKNVYVHGNTLYVNADNQSSSNIIMQDSDHGDRQIHCNSNRIGFLNQSGGWGSWCEDNGDFYSAGTSIGVGAMQAPVFYDYNNTAYYWEPATDASHRFQTPYGYIDIGPKNTSYCHIYTDRGSFYFNAQLDVLGNRVLNAGNYSNYAWPLEGSWKPASLASSTRLRGATSPDGGEFGLAYSGGQIHPYADGFFYQNEGAYRVIDTNSVGSYAVLARAQSNWAGSGVIDNVVGLLSWKNYGSSHVIFDASNGTTPSGTSCSTTNPQNNWTSSYPTLMGWNGSNTYGVRVDVARYADSAGSAGSATNATNSDNAGHLRTAYVGGVQSNPQVYFNNTIGLKAAMTAVAGVWSDTLWINGYSGGDVLQMCAMHFQRNGTPRAYISVQASTATSYGSLYELWTSYNMDAPNKSGTSYYQTNTWMQLNGAYGLYCPSVNAAHFYPNNGSYGAWKIEGDRNGWGGLEFVTGSNGNVSLMIGTNSATTGFHNNSSGWQLRWGSGTLYSGRGAYGGDESIVLQEDKWIGSKYFGSNGAIYGTVFYDANDSSRYVDPTSTGDSIRVSGDVVAYYSDERLKDRKGNIENALDKVLSLNGFYYTPNARAQELGYLYKEEVGVSAQEVEAILPEIIKDAPIGHGYKTLNYGKLTPLLIEAIKEQQTQIEELKELVKTLINK